MLRQLRFSSIVWWMAGMASLTWVRLACADFPSSVLSDQPRGYWRLNELDVSTAANLGTAREAWNGRYHGGEKGVPGPTELPDGTRLEGMGVNPQAYDVGGFNAFMSVDAPALSELAEFTFSAWISPRSRDEDWRGLWGQHDVIEFGFSQPNRLELWTAQGGSLHWDIDPNSDLTEDAWVHLAATGDGDQLRLYLNGSLVAAGGSPVATIYGSGSAPFNVGGGGIFDAEGNQFSGSLSELAVWDRALSSERLQAHFQAAIGGGIPGDFNGDGLIDLTDVNLLIDAIVDSSLDTVYDVDDNDDVDVDDLSYWVAIIKNTWVGDANLDGEFNSADFVQVFQRGQYEDATSGNSSWDDGDWNADTEFTSSDFVVAFQDGGYELGTRAIAAVPEPASSLWLLAGCCLLIRCRCRDIRR